MEKKKERKRAPKKIKRIRTVLRVTWLSCNCVKVIKTIFWLEGHIKPITFRHLMGLKNLNGDNKALVRIWMGSSTALRVVVCWVSLYQSRHLLNTWNLFHIKIKMSSNSIFIHKLYLFYRDHRNDLSRDRSREVGKSWDIVAPHFYNPMNRTSEHQCKLGL